MRAVTTEDGDLTPVGTLGFETCKLVCEEGRSHSVIHIAQQQKSFAAQQAMALSEIWNKRNAILCSQVGYIHSFINGGRATVFACTLYSTCESTTTITTTTTTRRLHTFYKLFCCCVQCITKAWS